ncbi:unnamed protein product [Blepharisma stoltei]|uniref:Uncharacterized protein n=1 Tax=Blepharisma stoltei TaxID=1481888 RepID=A0AAU9JSS1_9CILI|nr:unnamed protein product [Blepharisma stoltei]
MNKKRRTASYINPQLPPLTARTAESTRHKNSEFSLFSGIKEPINTSLDSSTAHKFFNFAEKKDEPTSVSLQISKFHLRSIHSSYDSANLESILSSSMQAMRDHSKWQISERLESYQMNHQKQAQVSYKSIEKELAHWNQCFDDIFPLIKEQSDEIANAISNIFGNIKEVFNDLRVLQRKNDVENNHKLLEFEKKRRSLEEEIKKIKLEKDEIEKIRRDEDKKIQSEIDEIYGDDDFLVFKQKAKRLLDLRPTGAAEILKEIYNEMNQDREIPKPKIFDGKILDPDDLETSLRLHFKLIQKTTAKRIIRLFDSKIETKSIEVQTTDPFIEQSSFEEAQKAAEKYSLLYQGLQVQEERLREELKMRGNTIEALENEKSQLLSDALKIKREGEMSVKEITNLKKENETIKKKLEENKTVIEGNAYKIALLENQLETQLTKIAKYTKETPKINEIGSNPSELSSIKFQDATPSSQNRGEINKSQFNAYQNASQNRDKNSLERPSRRLNSGSTINDREEEHGDLEEVKGISPSQSRATIQVEKRKNNRNLNNSINNQDGEQISSSRLTDRSIFSGSKSPRRNIDKSVPSSRNKESYASELKVQTKMPNRGIQNGFDSQNQTEGENDEFNDEGMQPAGSYKKTRKSKPQNMQEVEHENKNPGNSNLISSIGSLDSEAYHSRIGANGIEVFFVDRGLWTNDLKNENLISNSVGVQYDWEHPDEKVEEEAEPSNLYIFAYNPNNVFGLRGDVFFNKSTRVIQSQPRIPELQKSIMFQPSYHLDAKK